MALVQEELGTGFRRAMRRLAATVCIITTGDGKARYGMTATAVTSVTTDPPTLLVCVNRSASMHNPLIEIGRFCVNILCSHHAEVSRVFSVKPEGEIRFSTGEWLWHDGLPYLADAQANLFCQTDVGMPYQTHTLFIGKVVAVGVREEVTPLVYQDGGYVLTQRG